MSETRWVQHRSGDGDKWELVKEITDPPMWCVKGTEYLTYWLPKSEYRECEGPEEWEDVTSECEWFDDSTFGGISHKRISRFQNTHWGTDYRLRRVQLYDHAVGLDPRWAFIIEKRESK